VLRPPDFFTLPLLPPSACPFLCISSNCNCNSKSNSKSNRATATSDTISS